MFIFQSDYNYESFHGEHPQKITEGNTGNAITHQVLKAGNEGAFHVAGIS